jgi:4-hydroxybenzoyl-CoA thioesterase
MIRTFTFDIVVQFGDCDPAGIVFFPNYLRWMDASSANYFRQCGLPAWRDLQAATGIIGTPMLEIQTQFKNPSSYGDTLQITSSVSEWRNKVFVEEHRIQRGETLICQGLATRAFCIAHPDEPGRLKAIPIPPDIRQLCQ